jgi:hypothetical protein
MPDKFSDRATGLDSPAEDGVAVSPHDANDLTVVSRGLYVGVAGNISLVTANGTTLLFENVPVGTHPWRVKRVNATGTSAQKMIALW